MSLGLVNRDGEILVHRNMPAGPAPVLKAIAPSREDLVVWVACLFTWYWLADLGARAGMPGVLGHALSLQAMHGGTAQNDHIDAPKIAVVLRGGMLPPASGSPAELRATRDLLRRRRHLMRQRAERLAHIHKTTRQDPLPELGKKIASKAHRAGVAERCAAPAVPQSLAGDLARIGHDDQRLRDRAWAGRTTAQHHDATTRSLLRTVPGIGEILRLGLREEIPDLQRFPRVQDVVSSGRLVTWAKASAGKRSGTSGAQIGPAALTWAFAAAAGLLLRAPPAGQKSLARVENNHGKGKALTVRAPQLARVVYQRLQRATACERQKFLQREQGAGRMSPTPHWTSRGSACPGCLAMTETLRRACPRAPRPSTPSLPP